MKKDFLFIDGPWDGKIKEIDVSHGYPPTCL